MGETGPGDEPIAEVAVVRRAPRYRSFVVAGMLVAVVVVTVLVLAFGTGASPTVVILMIAACAAALLGGLHGDSGAEQTTEQRSGTRGDHQDHDRRAGAGTEGKHQDGHDDDRHQHPRDDERAVARSSPNDGDLCDRLVARPGLTHPPMLGRHAGALTQSGAFGRPRTQSGAIRRRIAPLWAGAGGAVLLLDRALHAVEHEAGRRADAPRRDAEERERRRLSRVERGVPPGAVSYTHLTLPTNRTTTEGRPLTIGELPRELPVGHRV